MYLIVGLGNPGVQYKDTRHNAGFIFIDLLAATLSLSFVQKYSSDYSQCSICGHKVFIQKPLTFMNKSGDAVLALASFYKIKPENIFVIHDDIDLKDGDLRIKYGGGNGGHNGLKSIDCAIGREYWRIRVGVGRPQAKEDVANYVLSSFGQSSLLAMLHKFKLLIDNLPLLLQKSDDVNTMNGLVRTICQT